MIVCYEVVGISRDGVVECKVGIRKVLECLRMINKFYFVFIFLKYWWVGVLELDELKLSIFFKVEWIYRGCFFS